MSRKLVTVKLVGEVLTIEVGLSTLATATRHMPELEAFDEETLEFFQPKVTDKALFGRELVRALRSEEEDGTTLVHTMLEAAIMNAIESGAEGIVTGNDQRIAAIPLRRECPHCGKKLHGSKGLKAHIKEAHP